MQKCPKCKRWSFDYDPFRKQARCLYLTDCAHSEPCASREGFDTRPVPKEAGDE